MPKPKKFNEKEALNVIMDVFWQKGYDGTSIDDLLQKLKIGKQSLYNAFGEKKAIFKKALDQYYVMSTEILDTLNSQNASFSDIKDYFLVRHTAFSFTDYNHKACFVGNTISNMSQEDQQLAEFALNYLKFVESAFENALICALRKGEIKGDLNVKSTAKYLVTMAYGLGILARAKENENELKSMIELSLSFLTNRNS